MFCPLFFLQKTKELSFGHLPPQKNLLLAVIFLVIVVFFFFQGEGHGILIFFFFVDFFKCKKEKFFGINLVFNFLALYKFFFLAFFHFQENVTFLKSCFLTSDF